MNLEVAKGSMRILAGLGRAGFLDGIGVSRADFERLVGDEPWLATDRNRMTALLHSCANASLDAQGLPRFSLPAEYLAAAIAMFVAPVNVHAACVFAPPAVSAEDAGRGVSNLSAQKCSSEQLFALVVQLYDSPSRNQARSSFEKSTKLALDRVMEKGVVK